MKSLLRTLIISSVMVILASCSTSSKQQIQSLELTANTASIVASREGAYILVVMDIAETFQNNSYAVIQYQQLSNPQKYKAFELGSIGESKRITFKSRPDKIVHSQTPYSVLVRLYDGPTYSQIVAQRSVLIMPNIPSKIADLMDIELR